MTKLQAVSFFGGKAMLAKAVGITKQAVSRWDEIPITRQFQIEVISKGKLKADRCGEAA